MRKKNSVVHVFLVEEGVPISQRKKKKIQIGYSGTRVPKSI
jgi:hypothetical protein